MFKCALGNLLNKGEFGLPSRYLQERGIKGEETISKAKRKLVELGFLDVVAARQLHQGWLVPGIPTAGARTIPAAGQRGR